MHLQSEARSAPGEDTADGQRLLSALMVQSQNSLSFQGHCGMTASPGSLDAGHPLPRAKSAPQCPAVALDTLHGGGKD